MPCSHPSRPHHNDAAYHYEKVALHHREAERLLVAEDPVTAAHHAYLASGHAVQGDFHAAEACKAYAKFHR